MAALTVEEWALAYILSSSLADKSRPSTVPELWQAAPTPLRVAAPGRPKELVIVQRSPRRPKPGALVNPEKRAQLLHTFWHHELQAAELMAWALLAFADAEPEFRSGLLRICLDEIRHMRLYQLEIERLGHELGSFPVRDWFWQRVPSCSDKVAFVALMGMGFEAANLEHAPEFAAQFRAVGDEAGARTQELVAAEELHHVRFATEWFRRWVGACDFDEWCRRLPPPLSPLTLRGRAYARALRLEAGMSEAFVDALSAWQPASNHR